MAKIRNISLLALLILISCAGPYTEKDNGSSVALSVNDTFEVILNGDLNSEYFWHLEKPNSFVKLDSAPSLETKDDQIEYTFRFKATGQGKERVLLVYTNGVKIEKTFELLMVIGTLGPIL